MVSLPEAIVARREIDWRGMNRRFLNEGEMEALVALCDMAHAQCALEIGTNTGRTSRLLLENCSTLQRVIGIDVPPGYSFSKTVQRNEVPDRPGEYALVDARFELRVAKHGSLSMQASDFPPMDFVFIDGDHGRRAVEHDTNLAREAIRPGGIIAWHDYHEKGNVDVKAVLDEQRAEGHDIRRVAGTWIAFQCF